MKKALFIALLFSGCASSPKVEPPQAVIKIDSNPQGARIFYGEGPTEGVANKSRSYIGTTPLNWTVPKDLEENGRFRISGAFLYSMAVPAAAVFYAEPTSTNLFKKKQVYHTGVAFVPPDKIPEGIFFDLTKP
jgi:hypothetical protein